MKVMYLGNAKSIHVQRWANYFNIRGWDVHILTRTPTQNGLNPGIQQHELFCIKRLEYLIEPINRIIRVRQIRRLISEIKPDLIHAHGLPQYGEYAYLAGFKPYVLTNWGLIDLTHIENYLHFFQKKLSGARWRLRKKAFENASAITALVSHAQEAISS